MYPRHRILPLALLTAALCALLDCSPHTATSTTLPALLTVDETLQLATTRYIERPPNAFVTRTSHANPAARPQLYARLSDPANAATWPSTVGLFAYVGQAEDVPRLLALITSRTTQPTPLSTNDYHLVATTLDVLNAMAARSVPGAKEAVEPTLHPAFWKTLPATPDNSPTVTMTQRALLAYIYSNPTDLDAKRTAAINELADPAQRTDLQSRTTNLAAFQTEVLKAQADLAAHPLAE